MPRIRKEKNRNWSKAEKLLINKDMIEQIRKSLVILSEIECKEIELLYGFNKEPLCKKNKLYLRLFTILY